MTEATEYFSAPGMNEKLQRYQRIYQEVANTPVMGLLPFIALIKELGNLAGIKTLLN